MKRQYVVIKPGTNHVLGGFWTADYDFASTQAARLGGVVTPLSRLERVFGSDTVSRLNLKERGPAKATKKGGAK
ncbi:hypothetical protein [Geminisphaera colitermitum]|uniref:hypothetical protein n=1 Tax=Geminisphaera colitermitum TaxID=1148786 RepID=UPI0001965554|nr:hypothetical protein [Geminisphaera colitermitum]